MIAYIHKENSDANKVLRLDLGAWLKKLRLNRGLSQRDLATQLNLEYYTFISQLENGRGKIPPSRYQDWARSLGQDPKDFVIKLLSCYDPITYGIIYGAEASTDAR
jgi:transcriptional regulator with XRE-family HTH domain